MSANRMRGAADATPTVLVVDDEQMIRWSIEQTLRVAGYEVVTAETGAEGLALVRQLDPDVVLLDLRLPDEDGLNLLKRIKEGSRPETAVIVMTAFGGAYAPAEALRMGALAYLAKPFDFDKLQALVEKALEAKPA